jgi:hypothetical protein
VVRIDQAGDLQAGLLLRLQHVVELEVVGRVQLDAIEAQALQQRELLQQVLTRLHHVVFDGLLEAVGRLVGLLLVGGQCRAGGEGGARGDEFAAVHERDPHFL